MAPAEPTRLRLVLMGEQRSGTTLLANVLDAQPGVRMAGGYLGALMYCAYRELGLRPGSVLSARQRNVLWQRVRATERSLQLEPTMPDSIRTLDDLHARLLERVARPGDRIVGHKIHGPVEALPSLLELTDVRCIYIVRDARDVMLSRSYRGESALDAPVKNWLASARAVRALEGHQNLWVVRFEDLVGTPDHALARLGRWLDLPDVSVTQLVSDDGKPTLQNSSHGDLTAVFDDHAIGRYRAGSSGRLMRFVQWRCAGELRRWGYMLDPKLELRLAERIEFSRRALVVESLELPRRAKNALLARALPSLVRDD